MDEHYIYSLMVKNLQQSISGTEQTELDKALIADSSLQQQFEKLKVAWQATADYKEDVSPDINTAWNKVQRKISMQNEAMVMPMYRSAWTIAASVVLLLGIGFLMYQQFSTPVFKQVATVNDSKEIKLPDGSTIWLNQHSTLSYPEKFEHNRQINLTGEAFFEVAKDPAHPFVIKSAGSTTQVLGTSFNVRAYDDEANIEVSVATGKVWFSAEQCDKKLVLLRGDKGVFSKQSKNVEKLKVEDNYLAWKTGELVFNHTMLPQVVEDLQRYYSIKLNIKDTSVTSVSFSGKLNRQPLNATLEILRSSLGLRIIRDSAQSWSVYSN